MKKSICFCFMLCGILYAGESGNLIRNGDFEKTDGWDKPDDLTSFWTHDSEHGRVLKLDSRVDRKQALAHTEARKKNPDAPAPVPLYSKPPAYDSIGGNEGVIFDSELIDVKPGQNYSLSVDVRGESAPFVWIKGFRKHPRRNMMIDCYQTRLHAAPVKNEWRTFSTGFNPTAKSRHTSKMKVRIYLYWPPGVCMFDNIQVREITPEEMAEFVKLRED